MASPNYNKDLKQCVPLGKISPNMSESMIGSDSTFLYPLGKERRYVHLNPYDLIRIGIPSTTISGSGKYWLEDALVLEPANSNSPHLRDMVNHIFSELVKEIPVSKPDRTKQALKTILINLWGAYNQDMPKRYSRRKNSYTRDKRYGMNFFKYHLNIPVIDTLEKLGYIDQKEGRFFSDKKFGRQTRMWCTPKLIGLYIHFGLITQDFYEFPEPQELIILRKDDKYKTPIKYRETPLTKEQRENLERYNNFVKHHEIAICLDDKNIVDNEFLIKYLYNNIVNNKIKLKEVILKKYQIITKPNKPIVLSYPNTYNVITRGTPYHQFLSTNSIQLPIPISHTQSTQLTTISSTMTDTFCYEPLMDVDLQDFDNADGRFLNYLFELRSSLRNMHDASMVLSEKFCLGDIGIEKLVFILVYEYLHRVYNRNTFELGGRAYGALHQNLPKDLRPYIHINGNETIEVDYSAYHIRMLYHLEGIDYRDDPYIVCEGPGMRKGYKVVGLIAINAKNDRSAYGAIRDEFHENGIPLPAVKKPLVRLVNTFRETHQPIAKYLFSDIGLRLQKIDSDVMDRILMSLMDKGILGLSVYDSVIAEKRYEGVLRDAMEREYENFMKYKPVI